MRARAWIRRLIWTVLGLAVIVACGFSYITRPSALRARLTALFHELDLRVERIGDISLSLRSGLEVFDVRVSASPGSPLAAPNGITNPPALVHVQRARVHVDAWSLLTGRFVARSVVLDSPAISLIRPEVTPGAKPTDASAGAWSWPSSVDTLPTVIINDADVRLFVNKGGRLRLQRRWVVDGVGEALADRPDMPREYMLRLDQVGGAAAITQAPDDPMAELRWKPGLLTARLGWVDLAMAQELLPASWSKKIAELGLAGRACARQVLFRNNELSSVDIGFDGISCVLPLEEQSVDPAAEVYAKLSKVRGSLLFQTTENPAGGEVRGLNGNLRLDVDGSMNDATVRIGLHVDDVSTGRLEQQSDTDAFQAGAFRGRIDISNLTLPTFSENPRFMSSQRLPESLRNWMRTYSAEGAVDIHAVVERAAPAGGVTPELVFHGEMEARGCSVRYARFPYPITDTVGKLRFSNDGIVIDGLCGRHGGGQIRADGRLFNTKSWTGFELTFNGRNIASDEALFDALPPKYRGLWRSADPIGIWDIETHLSREHGSDELGSLPTGVRVDARLLSGSLRLRDTDRLENADGLVRVAGSTVELVDLHGYRDGSPVCVDGTITVGEPGVAPSHNLRVEATNVALHQVAPVRDGSGQAVGEIEFAGAGDVWAQVLSGPGEQSEHHAARLRGGALTGFDTPAYWNDTRGWVSLGSDGQRIETLEATHADGRLAASGIVPRQLGLNTPITLELTADDAEMDRLLRQLMPDRWANIREALGISGPGRLTARFEPEAVDGGSERQIAHVHVEAERMRPAPIPLDLRAISADLTLRNTGFELHSATAECGEQGRIEIGSGQGGWGEGDAWTELQFSAAEIELTSAFVEAMPDALRDLLQRLTPSGKMHATFDRMRMVGGQRRQWSAVGRITLRGAELDLGIPLSGFDGELAGSCDILPDGTVVLDAQFAIDRGTLMSRPIERWTGELRRPAEAHTVRLENIRGQLCGGEIIGFGELDTAGDSYEIALTLHDIGMGDFLMRDESQGAKSMDSGRMDGRVFLRGSLRDREQRSGGGELRIRGASLLSSRVTASVVEASREQARPIDHNVNQAELRFAWEGREFMFNRVDIHAGDRRLIGQGSWNMSTDEISLTLLGATQEDALRLPLLTDLLEEAGQEFLQYRVEGTAANPRVTVEPLHNLTGPLKKMLSGE